MKCDELKAYKGDVTIPVYGTIADAEVYLKDKADEALSEKDHEIARLNTEIKEAVKTMKSQDVEIMELKKKLENVQATAYADSVDAGMRERRLRRALYKACANWAHHRVFVRFKTNEKAWGKVERKCRAKMEEYK